MSSWFDTYVEHPFMAAIEGLETNPAITSNPEASTAVSDAKKQAQTIAEAATTGTAAVIAAAQAVSDPALAALTSGLTVGVDGFLTAAIGPLGEELVAPTANTVLALGEQKAHDFITALFAHAAAQLKSKTK